MGSLMQLDLLRPPGMNGLQFTFQERNITVEDIPARRELSLGTALLGLLAQVTHQGLKI